MRLARALGFLCLGIGLGLGNLRAEPPVRDSSPVQTVDWFAKPSRPCGPCGPPFDLFPTPQGSGSASGSAGQQPSDSRSAQDQFASAQEAGSGASSSPANMFGDFPGLIGRIQVPTTTTITTTQTTIDPFTEQPVTTTTTTTVTTIKTKFVPLLNTVSIKLADNESPKPADRAYVTYNFFDNIIGSLNGSDFASTNMHREVFGFEKTYLDGNVSLGFRFPFVQETADGSGDSQFGDLTVILKYAFINDASTGNVLSGGLLLAVPTGKSFDVPDGGSVNPVFFEPWVGFLVNRADFFIQGFFEIAVPTDSRSVIIANSDVGIGYWVYRNEKTDALLSRAAPTVELHVHDPLDHRYSSTSTDPIFLPDEVNLTAGGVFVFRNGSQLGLAACTPLAGPKPFTFEALASLNVKF
jgi:hypothetical protein